MEEHDATFGQVVREIRRGLGETQAQFAARFPRSRNYVTNTELGDLFAKPFVEELAAHFPDYESRVRAAYETSLRQRPQKPRTKPQTTLQRKIESLIVKGSFGVAQRTIGRSLAATADDGERHWLHERLSTVLFAQGETDAAIAELGQAIACAVATGLTAEELTSRARLAARHQARAEFAKAHQVLDAGLLRWPDAPRLWLRKGKVSWYEQSYPEAYAALTTAGKHHASPLSVLHARGQVLAEWGSYDAALADITAYLAKADNESLNAAYVRSARAYVWGHTGDLRRALAEFDAVEPLHPESGWLHYRRGLVYVAADHTEQASSHLLRALQCSAPALNHPRRLHAEALLRQLGVDVPSTGQSSA